MNRKVVPLIALLAVLGLVVPCYAAETAPTMIVKIPFKFVVGETTLPAGTYEVEVGHGVQNPPVLVVQTDYRSENELRFRKVFASVVPEGETLNEGTPRLVFKKVGDKEFLEKVVPPSGPVEEVR